MDNFIYSKQIMGLALPMPFVAKLGRGAEVYQPPVLCSQPRRRRAVEAGPRTVDLAHPLDNAA